MSSSRFRLRPKSLSVTNCNLTIIGTVSTESKATIPMMVARDCLRSRIGCITGQDMVRVGTALKRSQRL